MLSLDISLSFCKQAEEKKDVFFDNSYISTHNFVFEEEKSVSLSFNESELINLKSNTDFNLITNKSGDISNIYKEVSRTSKDITLNHLDVSINNENYDAAWHVNVPISERTIITLNNHSCQYNAIKNMMTDENQIRVYNNSSADEANVILNVHFVI